MAARRVLVIEDDPGARAGLGSLLADDGYEVATAPSGEAGIRCAAEFRPDTVVCDVSLPGIDGLQVLRRFREMPGRRVYFVVLTATCGDPALERALRAEADLFLSKPIDLGRLRHVLAVEAAVPVPVQAIN